MNKIFPLPWWTYIIGYILSLISVGVCFYLIVEFGGVLGEQKTGEWLASITISLLQSIVLIQPIKVSLYKFILYMKMKFRDDHFVFIVIADFRFGSAIRHCDQIA